VRLPRDITGRELTALLRRHFDYEVVRQTCNHLRLATTMGGKHGSPFLRADRFASEPSLPSSPMSPSIRGLPERTWNCDCSAERRPIACPKIASTSAHQRAPERRL
jgi:hypothetical protein